MPCVKGRFHDAMQRKLHQLEASNSNEVTSVDFRQICNDLSEPVAERSG